jgi:hypothetical protein
MCQSKANGGRRCKPNKGRRSSVGAARTGGSASRGLSSQMRRTRRVVLRDAKTQLDDLLNSLVDAAPVNSPTTLVAAIDADAAGQISDAITDSLKANGWPPSKWRSHLLCGALAATAHAMDAAEDRVKELIVHGVTTALTSAGVPSPVAGMAARAALDAITKLPAYKQWYAVRRGVRLAAIAACPAVENHPMVVNYCMLPLASDYLPGAIQQELAQLPVNLSAAAG